MASDKEDRGAMSGVGGSQITDSLAIPSDYVEPYERARAEDPDGARNYIAHTMIADPVCDEMMAQLASTPLQDELRLLRSALENPDDPALRDAPSAVQAFVEELENVPDWVDYDDFAMGVRAFHRDSSLSLAAMLGGVLVEGFSTSIAKPFFITGRLRDQGVRRLRQNNRHMIEILLPGGLETRGDGWRLSVRIRLVHAKVRQLLGGSDDWDTSASGVPISAAQVGYALTYFSARMLQPYEEPRRQMRRRRARQLHGCVAVLGPLDGGTRDHLVPRLRRRFGALQDRRVVRAQPGHGVNCNGQLAGELRAVGRGDHRSDCPAANLPSTSSRCRGP